MARFEIDFLTEYTDEALLDELRRVASSLPRGEPLTKAAYKRRLPRTAHNTIQRRFGSWKQALGLAGLGHLYSGKPVTAKMRLQAGKGLSDADLVVELRRVHTIVGKEWLTTEDFNAHSVTGEDTIRNRFGTFLNGLKAAGIPNHPNQSGQFTNQQCFENVAAVWTHFARPPAYREMFSHPSTIQGKTYMVRWGTWRKALKAFADWANSDDPSQESNRMESAPGVVQEPARRAIRPEADCREVRPGLRFKVFMRDNFRCVTCGRSPATHLNVELHADHILAVGNGGKTVMENLQTLCKDCNLGKGRRLIANL
jgi:hypothetical protein